MALWSNLFTAAPTVFDAYNNTASALGKMRAQALTNALSQVKLKYAEPEAQQSLSQAIANTGILQNTLKYAPQMSQADLAAKYAQIRNSGLVAQGMRIDNAMKSENFKYLPDKLKLGLALQQAQIKATLSKVLMNPQHLQTAYDAQTGAPIQVPKTYAGLPSDIAAPSAPGTAPSPAPSAPPPDNSAPSSPLGSPPAPSDDSTAPDNLLATPQVPAAPLPSLAMPTPSPSALPSSPPSGGNPQAPDIMVSAGPLSARGQVGALYNAHTGEHYSVLTPTQRTSMQNQLISLRQAIPYLEQLKKYGTVGKFGATGINKFLPNAAGGVPLDVAAKYEANKAGALEHIMTGTKLQKTDMTTQMIDTMLDRQNGESRQGYTDRINRLESHLNDLDSQTSDFLGKNAIPLSEIGRNSGAQQFLEQEYTKAAQVGADKNGKIAMIGDDGKTYNVPANKVYDAMVNYHMRRK